MDDLELLTLERAAKLLGLSPSTLRVQLHNGRLHGLKRGRDWFVLRQEVERYRNESKGQAGRPRER